MTCHYAFNREVHAVEQFTATLLSKAMDWDGMK